MTKKILSLIGVVLIIPFMIKIAAKVNKKRKLRKRVLQDSVSDHSDTARNIVSGISGKSKELYLNLITKVHPDKFLDDKRSGAAELAQKIIIAKRNYSELLELEKEVNIFLES